MSETQKQGHTPGPWNNWTDPDGGKWVTFGDNSMTICKVTVRDGMGRSGQNLRDIEGSYNAFLLAAAPDLLEACRMSLKILNDAGWGNTEATHELRTAISRAEGRA